MKKAFNKKSIALALLVLSTVLLGGNYRFEWLIVALVTYNVIFNNAIQTIGLFIASNKNRKPFFSVLFFGTIALLCMLISWYVSKGEVHYHLLDNISYRDEIGLQFLLLPILLAYLTKKQMPVSATFLIIPLFATKDTIATMINKTTVSYFLSLLVSFIIYNFLYRKYRSFLASKDESKIWIFAEYISTGVLWFGWLCISLCNFVVFVPRQFTIKDIILLTIIIVITIYCIIISKGGKIQKIIDQKSDVKNIKTTVIFNSLFSFMLLSIQIVNNIPMASTWMFLGILAGREIAITMNERNIVALRYKSCMMKVWKDLRLAIIGIVLSLLFVRIFGFMI